MSWSRKHVCDLAGACKQLGEDPLLSAIQRNKFAETYRFAKQFSSFPNAGGAHNVTAVITMVCDACQATLDNDCVGRYDWHQACLLIQNR